MKKPKLLITNDDGIQAPGIFHLWQALSTFADTYIVAPASEQSGKGVSITIGAPLKVQTYSWHGNTPAWSVTGTPADCVKMALSVILSSPPDLIVSGINRGTNAGRNVLYSGTIGGVIEGVLRGIPGVAFSSYDMGDTSYQHEEAYIPSIIEHVLENPLPKGTLLNVNFPRFEKSEGQTFVKGFKLTRQGKQYWIEDPNPHPEHDASFWMGSKLIEFDEDPDSDIHWLKKGFLTAVPVHVDELTDHLFIHSRREHFEGFLQQKHS